MPWDVAELVFGSLQDVDSLMEKHSVLEKDFLKEKEQDALSFQARYRELQVSSKHALVFRHAR